MRDPIARPRALAALTASLLLGCATAQQHPADRSPPMLPVPRVAVPLIEHHLSAEEIRQRSQAAEQQCERALAAIVAVPTADRSFANTVEAMEQAIEDYVDVVERLGILKHVHRDEKVRVAAAAAEEASAKYLVRIASRRDLYRAVRAWQQGAGARETLDAQQRRLLELQPARLSPQRPRVRRRRPRRLVALRTRLAELRPGSARTSTRTPTASR